MLATIRALGGEGEAESIAPDPLYTPRAASQVGRYWELQARPGHAAGLALGAAVEYALPSGGQRVDEADGKDAAQMCMDPRADAL